MATRGRIRVVEGSCLPCRKRRTKCDLIKPCCTRCHRLGTACSYNSKAVKWSTRPTPTAPASFQIVTGHAKLVSSLAIYEQRALEYFGGRLWPLLTTEAVPCSPPTLTALEDRAVLLAACVVADTHRILQDGRNSPSMLMSKRGECLAAVRGGLVKCCSGTTETQLLTPLLLAVLLLYFNDGYLGDSCRWEASTASHKGGVKAIIRGLGGIQGFMHTASDPLQMLISEFASGDVTTALLRGGVPSFESGVWNILDIGCVWWSRDPMGQYSFATVLQQMSEMAFYCDSIAQRQSEFDVGRVRKFEAALNPSSMPMISESTSAIDSGATRMDHEACQYQNAEVLGMCSMLRAFQHAALIYLYRAICGMSVTNPEVQHHTLACLDELEKMQKPSKIINCSIYPLLVAGAHAQCPGRRRSTLKMAHLIHGDMKFASVHAVSRFLEKLWRDETANMYWLDMFRGLGSNIVVL